MIECSDSHLGRKTCMVTVRAPRGRLRTVARDARDGTALTRGGVKIELVNCSDYNGRSRAWW
jgi:hypothetical protein